MIKLIDNEQCRRKDEAWNSYKKAIDAHQLAHEAYYKFIDNKMSDDAEEARLVTDYISTDQALIKAGDFWRSINIMMVKE